MEEERLQKDGKRKGLSALSYTAIAILIIFTVFMLVNFFQGLQIKKAYSKAEALCFEGNYSQALEEFNSLDELNYRDTGAFISYCRARICASQQRWEDAETDLIWASFKYLDEGRQQEVSDFETLVQQKLAENPPVPGQYQMEFYPDEAEFFYYHGQDFKDYDECADYYFVNQASK